MAVVNPHVHTEQEILNSSFDETYGVLATLGLEIDPSGTAKRVVTGDLALRYAVNGTATYVGEATPSSVTTGAVWRIFKFDSSTGSITWADGNTSFDNVWDDYLTLSYT